ncbi:hypothetical protein UlMin_018644 [Ulmus minor]
MMAFLVSMNAPVEAAAKELKVGGNLGWKEPGFNDTNFYIQWAELHRFRIGDSIVFEYKNDSVMEVEKFDYYHCNASNPITSFNNGKSVFKLDRPGSFYFISGAPMHCKNGQRLLVEVMSPHPIRSPPPSSAAAPPEPYFPLSPSPTTTPHSSAGALVSFARGSLGMAIVATLAALV